MTYEHRTRDAQTRKRLMQQSRLILQIRSGTAGPIALAVPGPIDGDGPMIAAQETQAPEIEIVDAAGISVDHHDHRTSARLDITHAGVFDLDEILFRRFTLW